MCFFFLHSYTWYFLVTLQELGLIRKPASFMTSICDERGQELIYAGMPITEVFKSEIGLGGTLGLLWFQRRSDCKCKFSDTETLERPCFIDCFPYVCVCVGCPGMPVSSLRCVWWWQLITALLFLVPTTLSFVPVLAKISSPVSHLACSPL